jgi:hypothetical protein
LPIALDHIPTLDDAINFAAETGLLNNIRTEATVRNTMK